MGKGHGKPLNIENAKKFFYEFNSIVTELKIPYMLFFGTALGAYRDGGFIDVDRDMDFACYERDIRGRVGDIATAFKEAGFRVEVIDHRHKCDWDGREFAIKLKKYGERADFIFLLEDGDYYYSPGHTYAVTYREKKKVFQEMDEKDFYGVKVRLPKKEFYEGLYGKNWHIPDTKFTNVADYSERVISDI